MSRRPNASPQRSSARPGARAGARWAIALFAALTALGCHAPAGVLQLGPAAPAAPTSAAASDSARPGLGALGNGSRGPAVVPDQLIAVLASGRTPESLLAQPSASGFTLRAHFQLGGREVLKLGVPAGATLIEARARLAKAIGVERVSEDLIPRPAAFSFTQRDPRLDEQWAHRADTAATLDAWEKVPASDQGKVIVAVLDTGCDVAHPEFAGRIVGAQNFTTGGAPDADVTDTVGHGTHVAGIIGAAGNNGAGVAGVAWGVKLMPVKVLGGQAGSFDVIQGLLYAVRFAPVGGASVRVVNMSLGTPSAAVDSLFAQAVAEARAKGVVVVAAAGNDGREAVDQPANTPGVFAVGATARYLSWESLAAFSNYGDRVDLVAPGEGILSTLPTTGSDAGQNYGYESGTSMAAPYVAGVAALVTARYDALGQQYSASFVDQVATRLRRAVDDLGTPGRDPVYGAGRLNAKKAVTAPTLAELI